MTVTYTTDEIGASDATNTGGAAIVGIVSIGTSISVQPQVNVSGFWFNVGNPLTTAGSFAQLSNLPRGANVRANVTAVVGEAVVVVQG